MKNIIRLFVLVLSLSLITTSCVFASTKEVDHRYDPDWSWLPYQTVVVETDDSDSIKITATNNPEKKEEILTEEEKQLREQLLNVSITLKSNNKKSSVELLWKENIPIDLDFFEVYRSEYKYHGYGTKPIITTKNHKCINAKNIIKNKIYYYKIRGVVKEGEKLLYTPFSNKISYQSMSADYNIKWHDKHIEKAVRIYLRKPSGAIKASDLDKINKLALHDGSFTSINVNNKSYEIRKASYTNNSNSNLNLMDLKNFRNLKEFYSSYYDRVSCYKMTGLKNLEKLGLNADLITDMINMRKITHLTELDLSGTDLGNYDCYSTLVNLKHLDISNTNSAHVQFVKNLKNLEVLKIYNNKPLTTIKPIVGLKKLKQITYSIYVKDIDLLSNKIKKDQLTCSM